MQKNRTSILIILLLIPVINVIYVFFVTKKLVNKFGINEFKNLRQVIIIYNLILFLIYIINLELIKYLVGFVLFPIISITCMLLLLYVIYTLSKLLKSIKVNILKIDYNDNKLFNINILTLSLLMLLSIISIYGLNTYNLNKEVIDISINIFNYLPIILTTTVLIEFLFIIKKSLNNSLN